ncbi:MAG TPA: Kdo hydroxylase family protein [Bryobacteraceae bacterium]|nr:Kdo hydroxylase family protein [Bryobacteraceae bacterium]
MRLVEISATESGRGDELAAELEQGNILFLPSSPLLPSTGKTAILRDLNRVDTRVHKNIAYKPQQDRVTGLSGAPKNAVKDVGGVLRAYSRDAVSLVQKLIPRYAANWHIDYASFRPQEEQGRDLPWKKRNDLLHVDAFPTRPTRGDLILRVFTNVHQSRTRDWLTSEPFAWIARRYGKDAGLEGYARQARSGGAKFRRTLAGALGRIGLPFRDRTPYDSFMLHLHDYLKHRDDYQASCPKYDFRFPPGSSWMVFTDIVPHAVMAGQYALEQTIIVPRSALAKPEAAPAAILEQLAGVSLTD